ncbi:MAG: hypothetical protein U1A27_06445 [Phycisphaerae bacterium]
MTPVRRAASLKSVVVGVIAVLILLPASYGFIEKLILFVQAVRKDQVAGFTIVPVTNYLIVTAGMACLLGWAIFNGMFRDIEKPKHDMLQREADLDRAEGRPWE